ncbi:hypothetical protein CRUP_030933 [Coryphaenoides rupestris]|nr:hypothetical protein CRUP_030933 [Coryphaenoides rupestris]
MPGSVFLIHIPFISNYLTRRLLAKKIDAGHFKSLVLSSLDSPERQASTPPCSSSPELSNGGCVQEAPGQYLYLELQLGGFETVEVTQVTDSLSLFCKLTIFSKELRKLSKQMQQHYNGRCVPGPGQPLASGSPCATRGTDGKWHRSLLTQGVTRGTSSVEVLHVDCDDVNKSSGTNMDMTNGFFRGSMSSRPRNPPANGRADDDDDDIIKCVDQKCWPRMQSY